MKYISAVLLVVLLAWTWSLASGNGSFNLESHKRVEAGVEDDIHAFIKKRYPTTTDIFCQQLYTEDVGSPDDLIAHFRCQSVAGGDADDAAVQMFEGFLRLHTTDGWNSWGETGGEIVAKSTEFINGTKVTPEKSDRRSDQKSDQKTPEEPEAK